MCAGFPDLSPLLFHFLSLVHGSCKLLHCPSVDDCGAAGAANTDNCKRKKRGGGGKNHYGETKLSIQLKSIYSITEIQTDSIKFAQMLPSTNIRHMHTETHTDKHIVLSLYVYILYI